MKSLIIMITGSLILLSNFREKTKHKNTAQISLNAVIATSHKTGVSTQQLNEKVEAKYTLATSVLAGWNGKYSAYFSYGDIAGQHAGWELQINITNNKITATGKGFQMAFVDELSATVSGSKLILTHLKNLSGYARGKTMKPEFILIKNKGKFYVKSAWINGDVITKPAELGYKIDRTNF